MFEEEIRSKLSALSLEEAILASLECELLFTDDHGCTLGGLEVRFADKSPSVWTILMRLIEERKIYFTAPLSLVDDDTVIRPIRWHVGSTKRASIEHLFGSPHRLVDGGRATKLVYDIYVEDVDDPASYPQPPGPFSDRNAACHGKPAGCSFPYAATWPPEALQVEFDFTGGILSAYKFGVGTRLT